MKFDRWFWNEDTPPWERAVTVLLWVITAALVVTMVILAVAWPDSLA